MNCIGLKATDATAFKRNTNQRTSERIAAYPLENGLKSKHAKREFFEKQGKRDYEVYVQTLIGSPGLKRAYTTQTV